MATSSDLDEVFNQISSFWPDFSITKEDLRLLPPEFVVRFYTAFMDELVEKILYFINEEEIKDEFDDIQDFDQQIILYCKVAKLLKKLMPSSPFDPIDFIYSNPKKMFPFIKCSIHFLSFIDIHTDDINVLLSENMKKLHDCEDLKILKQQLMNSIGENAEKLGRHSDTQDTLKIQSERLKKLYDEMSARKIAKEKVLSQRTCECNNAKYEVENLEYQLLLLESEERELNDALITEDEYESLTKTEKCLERELQQDSTQRTQELVNKTNETLAVMERCAKHLSELQFDCGFVEALIDITHQINTNSTERKKLTTEIDAASNVKSAKIEGCQEIQRLLDQAEAFYVQTESQCLTAKDNEEKTLRLRAKQCGVHFEAYQKLNTEIVDVKRNIIQLQKDEDRLDAKVAENYKKILKDDKKVTNKFHQVLLDWDKYRRV